MILPERSTSPHPSLASTRGSRFSDSATYLASVDADCTFMRLLVDLSEEITISRLTPTEVGVTMLFSSLLDFRYPVVVVIFTLDAEELIRSNPRH